MTSIEDIVIEAVMDLINAMNNFKPIRRGALGTGESLTCELAPSTVDAVFLDKNAVIILDLTLNGKHSDLQILSATMNNIVDHLTQMKTYPSGSGWEIVDIMHGAPPKPHVIGREENNDWIMAGSVFIKFYRKDD